MTPEEKQSLQYHLREVAKILHQNSDPKTIETLEGIEATVRAQVLEHVSPDIGIFLSSKPRTQPQDEADSSRVC